MGQQQLLLIVLGVIIVGIAIVVGINLFNANAEESAKDTLVSEGTNIGAMAQQFFKKPVALGGGGNSFTTSNGAALAWSIPPKLAKSSLGIAWTPDVQDASVTLTCTNDETVTGYSFASVVITITPTGIESVVNQ
jgi:hypothetical protein